MNINQNPNQKQNSLTLYDIYKNYFCAESLRRQAEKEKKQLFEQKELLEQLKLQSYDDMFKEKAPQDQLEILLRKISCKCGGKQYFKKLFEFFLNQIQNHKESKNKYKQKAIEYKTKYEALLGESQTHQKKIIKTMDKFKQSEDNLNNLQEQYNKMKYEIYEKDQEIERLLESYNKLNSMYDRKNQQWMDLNNDLNIIKQKVGQLQLNEDKISNFYDTNTNVNTINNNNINNNNVNQNSLNYTTGSSIESSRYPYREPSNIQNNNPNQLPKQQQSQNLDNKYQQYIIQSQRYHQQQKQSDNKPRSKSFQDSNHKQNNIDYNYNAKNEQFYHPASHITNSTELSPNYDQIQKEKRLLQDMKEQFQREREGFDETKKKFFQDAERISQQIQYESNKIQNIEDSIDIQSQISNYRQLQQGQNSSQNRLITFQQQPQTSYTESSDYSFHERPGRNKSHNHNFSVSSSSSKIRQNQQMLEQQKRKLEQFERKISNKYLKSIS